MSFPPLDLTLDIKETRIQTQQVECEVHAGCHWLKATVLASIRDPRRKRARRLRAVANERHRARAENASVGCVSRAASLAGDRRGQDNGHDNDEASRDCPAQTCTQPTLFRRH